MKIVADNKIPFVSDFFTSRGDLIFLPGESINKQDLITADILLTRTITPVTTALLSGTTVQFVGTATTGTDHIDKQYLEQFGIFLATAEGANSSAVAEYVALCVSSLQQHQLLMKKNGVIGIIGRGRIGALVEKFFKTQGFSVFCYDPFLIGDHFTSLEKLMRESDIISIHTPLTKTGPYPTFHMIDSSLIQSMKKNAILINTSRGGVIDQNALLSAKNNILCLDVWENEPAISTELLQQVFIGTPHIAGYSLDAKFRATRMIYDAAATYFGWHDHSVVAPPTKKIISYDPHEHTQSFRASFKGVSDREKIQKIFMRERKNYPLR